jgi:hypothetical protein
MGSPFSATGVLVVSSTSLFGDSVAERGDDGWALRVGAGAAVGKGCGVTFMIVHRSIG